jgi:hypothetical protein
VDSDLVIIGLTGIGSIRKISVLDWFLSSLRDVFHIGLVIGPRLLYWRSAAPQANTAGLGPITRPI